MESNPNFVMTGVIQGKTRDTSVLKEFMQSTVNSIMTEISKEFPPNNNFVHIYHRYDKKRLILKIFVVFFSDTKYNYRNLDINYLITLDEKFPSKPPMVFCLTEFNPLFDIFDMRNILKNLIPEWKTNNSIVDIINELPTFANSIDYQVSQKILPNVGDFIIGDYKYDINDFLLNPNNILFKIYILPKDYKEKYENKSKIDESSEKYLVITKTNFIIFTSVSSFIKNICRISYIGELNGIDSITRFIPENLTDYSCLNIKWNYHTVNMLKSSLCVEQEKLTANKINGFLITRRDLLFNNFIFFENNNDNDVDAIETIIKVKEEFIRNNICANLFYQIHRLYKKIVDIFISLNDEGYKVYLDKLKKFLGQYQKMKEAKRESLK